MDTQTHSEVITALRWYIDQGVDEALLGEAVDRTIAVEPSVVETPLAPNISTHQQVNSFAPPVFLGKTDALKEAIKLAASATTLDELKHIISEFDGLAIRKTASNIVFADGNPKADIMLIGDAPAADEDRAGTPFVGAHGELLDKILGSIGLARNSDAIENCVYIANILNWRPPGNRTPTTAEIEVSLPFIERHIELINPKILILCGSVSAKSLLRKSESISKLRKKWHEYSLKTSSKPVIPAIVTYAPSSLLKNPLQKKSVWADMLSLQTKINN